MSEEALHLKFMPAPGYSQAINRILRNRRSLPERGILALLTLLGFITGVLFVLLIIAGIAVVMIILLGGLIELIAAHLNRDFETLVRVVFFSVPYIIILVPTQRWIRQVVRSNVEVDEPPRELELVIDTRGIIARDLNSSSILTWGAVERVLSDQQNIFLFLGKRRAFVIPRSAFDDPAAADRLIALAERSMSAQVGSPQFRSDWVVAA